MVTGIVHAGVNQESMYIIHTESRVFMGYKTKTKNETQLRFFIENLPKFMNTRVKFV